MSSPTPGSSAARVRLTAALASEDAIALLACPDAEGDLLAAAASVRDRVWGRTITYSPKVFLPVTNLCRDRCTYCTFRKDPGDPDAWTMSPGDVRAWSARGRALGCIEALMCLGDKPELAFPSHRETLRALGHATTVEYLRRACEIALESGLLPHTNAGVLSREEMVALRPVNVSMGLMLESVSERLRGRGGVHQWAPDKEPRLRLAMLEEAGRLRIPFTTGLLLGIGETLVERVETLAAIAAAHRRHGHVQEVIVQSFRAKPTIARSGGEEPDAHALARTIAIARLLLPPEVSVQAPPNLSAPDEHALLLAAGVNDWGGISPLTPDYVNPEAPWPHVAALTSTCRRAGYDLVPRLPIYDRYRERAEFLDPALRATVGRRAEEIAPSSASWTEASS